MTKTAKRMPCGEASATYKGGTVIDKDGYVRVRGAGKFQLEHRITAEHALGRALKPGEVVHHINGIRTDNRPANLLICTDAYHRLIHTRQDALTATGNPCARRCVYCRRYDDPEAMTKNTQGKHYHKACAAAYQRSRKEKHHGSRQHRRTQAGPTEPEHGRNEAQGADRLPAEKPAG